jgi:hypothetical protein
VSFLDASACGDDLVGSFCAVYFCVVDALILDPPAATPQEN